MIFRRLAAHRQQGADWFAAAPAPTADPGDWLPSPLRSPVVLPGHAVIRSRDGQLAELGGRELSRPSDRYRQVDLRRRQLVMSPQSIAAAEGIDVQVTAVIVVRVEAPLAFVSAAADPDAEVYLAVQVALREAVARTAMERVLLRELDLAPVRTAADSAARQVGLAIEDVVLKDASASRQIASARAPRSRRRAPASPPPSSSSARRCSRSSACSRRSRRARRSTWTAWPCRQERRVPRARRAPKGPTRPTAEPGGTSGPAPSQGTGPLARAASAAGEDHSSSSTAGVRAPSCESRRSTPEPSSPTRSRRPMISETVASSSICSSMNQLSRGRESRSPSASAAR